MDTKGKNIVVGGVYEHYNGSEKFTRTVIDIKDEGFSAKTVIYDDYFGGGACIKNTFCKACPKVISLPEE
jgi:hypothetical protein